MRGLQVEADEAASSQAVASGRRTRFLWTALGCVVLMLIGASAWAVVPHDSSPSSAVASYAFTPTLQFSAAGIGPAVQTGKGLRPAMLPGVKHRRPVSAQRSSLRMESVGVSEGLETTKGATLTSQGADTKASLPSIQLADKQFKGNVAQYLVDLADSNAKLMFCGSMAFELRLTDMMRSHLEEVAKSGVGQPEVYDASTSRMNRIPGYEQSDFADNVHYFHGRELRQTTRGGSGFVFQLSHSGEDPEGWSSQERSTYDGWGMDRGRVWRKADMYENEGWANFKETYGDRAFGLNHRSYLHLDNDQRLWLSAEDGCEGVYPPDRRLEEFVPFLPQILDVVKQYRNTRIQGASRRLQSDETVSRCGYKMHFQDAETWSRSGFLRTAALATVPALLGAMSPARAEAALQPKMTGEEGTQWQMLRPIQFIAANVDPTTGASASSSGEGAQQWGIWTKDPGPRGVQLRDYPALEKSGGVAPAKWQFDKENWWLEEHGLIMEAPDFPLSPGKYLVTGGRSVTTSLTIEPNGKWSLGNTKAGAPALLSDVTHLPCRAARYTGSSPLSAKQSDFPVTPGAAMPPVNGAGKKDYAVLFVVGKAV